MEKVSAAEALRIGRLDSVGQRVKLYAVIDPAVHRASTALIADGGQVYVVGGAVRDTVMGKEPDDIDLMVTDLSEDRVGKILAGLPGHTVHEGRNFKVFHYRHKGHVVHIALPRRERSTGPGHLDFHVAADHTMTAEEDFSRRDFTANAMGVNLATGEFLDPFGGEDDIKAGTLRTLSASSLAEDPLRVIRGLVMHARHGLAPDPLTRAQMTANAPGLLNLPAERIQEEMDKIMSSPDPAGAMRLAHETGALAHFLPELEEIWNYDQNNPHHEQLLGEHSLNVLTRIVAQSIDPDLLLAALLHDIGKPGSQSTDSEHGTFHFYGHEKLSVELARKRLNALRYPKDRTARICAIIGGHMWGAFTTMRGARRFLHTAGTHADDLITLRLADQGKAEYPDPSLNLDIQKRLIARVRQAAQATQQSQIAVNGNDLLAAGVSQGPMMGRVLAYLTEQVIENPLLNDPTTLVQMAREYANLAYTPSPQPIADNFPSRPAV